jgi:hypothetical protein
MYIKPDNTDLRTATVSHEATALAGLFEAKSTLSTTSRIPARVCACQAIDGRKKKKKEKRTTLRQSRKMRTLHHMLVLLSLTSFGIAFNATADLASDELRQGLAEFARGRNGKG